MNPLELEQVQQSTAVGFARGYANHLCGILSALDFDAIGQVIETLLQARIEGRRIFFIGNGGSASTASHFAIDIGLGTRADPPFRALSLTDNNAVITAIANDHGYDEIFVRQLQVLMEPGDVVVAISASGNSGNLVRAVEYAAQCGGRTIGLLGFDGGRLKDLCDTVVHVRTERGEYGPVEDAHLVIDHLITAYLSHHVGHAIAT